MSAPAPPQTSALSAGINNGGVNSIDDQRGRRRVRDNEDEDDDMESGGPDGANGGSKKRRRSRKGLDKKFECPQEGCGKSYSRAEHLYRHQLNHNPKQIYRCDFPDCQRSFVRQDLCARHKERHTARGSQLLRKDNFIQNPNPIVTAALSSQQNALRHNQHVGHSAGMRPHHFQTPQPPHDARFNMQSPVSGISNSSTGRSDQSPPLDPAIQSPTSDLAHTLARTSSDLYSRNDHSLFSRQHSYTSTNDSYPRTNVAQNMQSLSLSASPFHGGNSAYPTPGQSSSGYHPASAHAANYQPHQNFPSLSALPPPQHNTIGFAQHHAQQAESDYSSGPMQMESQGQAITQATEAQILETLTPQFSMPVFGGEGISRSPFAMADDFTAWLFNDPNVGSGGVNPSQMPFNTMMGSQMAAQGLGLNSAYMYDTPAPATMNQPFPSQHPMAVNSILDSSLPESQLSEERRLQIIDLLETRFNDVSHLKEIKKEEIIEGAKGEGHPLLSPNMMQTYITSYWIHFHAQMPILHRPTFSANHCPELLLIAVMAVGASCLERTHGYNTTQQCSELANYLACNLRWEVFMDADFRPPAKLWVFQALILLECYEKMYATRPLHERAHIHHATTLTLMRRGSSLIGRSSLDSPPSVKGERHGSGTINGTVIKSGATTPDDWWNKWITGEATKRAAFAAFVMDSIHATMFGHSAVMVAHEMRLALPCDEALWAAASSGDVARAEQLNHQNGVKPLSFLDGLKKTLNNQSVRTNAFGRTIIMAGLLSVSWHMNQRDLQVSSLGVSSALGGRDKWRGALTRAFDFWKVGFDEGMRQTAKEQQQRGQALPSGYNKLHPDLDPDNIFEGRTVLHHLAHMAMHVDIVDCQIFAGARRLLGRSITAQDSAGARRRMKEHWAPSARARDATFYALRFLGQVLLPDEHPSPGHAHEDKSRTTSNTVGYATEDNPLAQYGFTYSARDDFLLHRPWVLYFATLIVFSYGFALDGPLNPPYSLPTDSDKVRDLQLFLQRVGGVQSPDDLRNMKHRNACLGLLVLLKDMFGRTRWELMHEAGLRLSDCVDLLTGQERGAGSGTGTATGSSSAGTVTGSAEKVMTGL